MRRIYKRRLVIAGFIISAYWVKIHWYLSDREMSFFTVSGSTLLRENVFIWVLVYPDFLVALEPGEKNWGRRKKSEAGEKSIKQEKKDFFSCLLGILASD